MRALPKKAWPPAYALARFPDRFPDADALVLARRARLALAERPARMRQSHNRHSMHGGGRAVAYTFNMFLSLLVADVLPSRRLPLSGSRRLRSSCLRP